MYRFYYHPHIGYDKDGKWYTGQEWIGTDSLEEAMLRGTMIVNRYQYERLFA